MRLKSLRIKGFKSFANDTVINFNENVIGIVGPNGSGKSNVIDAIRWVLGEQKSKELRLDKMTSVIFNGTKKKKSSGIAEVALTFDNTKNLLPTEYNTVTISRTLYKSGESEYRLNDVKCRLKDIASLFLDTGIGSNSYAIIELKMVDSILMDTNNARRKMFEQASGISKYKKRKHETLNKLDSTKGDLDRVEDLLFEIEGNLKTLEKQAKRTEKYFALKEKYKVQSISLAKHKLSSFETRLSDFAGKILDEEQKLTEFTAKKTTLESELQNVKTEILESEQLLSGKQKEFNDLVKSTDDKENNLKIIEQKLQYLKNDQSKLETNIQTANTKINEFKTRAEDYRRQLTEVNAEKNSLESIYQSEQEKLDQIKNNHEEVKKELDEILSRQKVFQDKIIGFERDKAILLSQNTQLEQESEKLKEQVRLAQERITQFKAELESTEAEFRDKSSNLSAIEQKFISLTEQKNEKEVEKERLTGELSGLNRTLDAKQNEFNLVKSLVEKMEGFADSVKFLSNKKNWEVGAPLLTDLIYCKDEYKVAIENYLDRYLQYFVVDNFEDAANAVKLLGKSQKGRANFFILDAIASSHNATNPSSIGMPALDVVEYDKKYEKLFEYLLGNVFLTTEATPDQSPSLEDNQVLLSVIGNYSQEKYSLSGGSLGLFEGKRMGRKMNLEKLEVQISELSTKISELDKLAATNNTALTELNAQLGEINSEEVKAEINKIQQQRMSFNLKIETEENQILGYQKRIQEIEASNMQNSSSISSILASIGENELALSNFSSSVSTQDVKYSNISEQLSALSSNVNAKQIELMRCQNKTELLERELKFCVDGLEENKNLINSSQSNIKETSDQIAQGQQNIENIKSELVELYAAKKERSENLSDVEKTYFGKRNAITDQENALKKYDASLNQINALLSTLKEGKLNVKLELTSITERLRAEFNIDANDLEAYQEEEGAKDKEIDEAALSATLDKLKNRIHNFGEINPMALTAFDEMKERYDTINEQRADILQARDSLLETIAEIELSASTQFMKAFTEVRTNFKEVFRSLFTEDDDCDLILEDEENPLESSIKIIAKPKGKRPQAISQLSGGEKTLTATALLFSLYLLKPAPFCIFDEVDAPLDDANIDKFNRIIRKFSGDSQFIIVTHNKQTMAAVDVIYGVYMQEQGVSAVSPVDFRELDNSSVFELAAS